MKLSQDPNYQTYHRVLNRAVWSRGRLKSFNGYASRLAITGVTQLRRKCGKKER